MKRSTFSKIEMSTRRIALVAVMLFTALCFVFVLMSSSAAQAEGLGGTGYTTAYSSQEEVYDAANLFNERMVEEGIVLLKNVDNALPLAKGSMINVLGKNSANIAIGGTGSSTGSGSVEARKAISLYQSLANAEFVLNPALVAFYENNTLSGTGRRAPNMGANLTGLSTGETPPEMYSAELKATYADYDDASIVVITRIGGEGYDLPTTMLASGLPMAGSLEGDHYLELDLYEKAIFASLEEDPSVSKVIVIVNASQQMELGFLNDSVNYSKVKAAIWVGGPGQSGVASIGRILNGDVNPSGRLVDTFAADFSKDPVWYNFGNSGGRHTNGTLDEEGNFTTPNGYPRFVNYEEGIYLGYRYWETAGYDKNDNWAWYDQNVVFPLGYGLSYTSFSWELVGEPTIPTTFTATAEVEVTVKVTNTGSVAGKDVVQLYYTAPYYNGGIEKSYVRLADFAKTPLLEPDASANVTMKVSLKDLASYDYNDANGNDYKGYELEAGNYVFRVLKNANARSVNGVADFTMTVPEDNEKPATAGKTGVMFTHDEKTGALIKNLFDDVSQKAINGTLEDKATEAVRDSGGFMNVMTRATESGGLAGTIPTDYPSNEKRTVSAAFRNSYATPSNTATRDAADLVSPWYKEEFPTQAANDQGEVTVFLKDLIGKDFDDPLWDAFLNQMTYYEMAYLIGHGAFHTYPIERLGKPWSVEIDGPVGLVPRQVNGPLMDINNHVSCVYATQPVVAATWNKELVKEYGQMTGEESIWGNTNYAYSGIYGPGLNIHRSPFSGRNFEYYSEDGVLSGKMAGAYCLGAYEKGLYTMMKHYVLNDQETNRNGIQTWADEQTMREIYFLPFEKAIKDGNSRGAMAAYNSIGKTWTGASYALMTDLTRNEWGFEGMIITDWGSYSATTNNWMIRAGTDLLLGGSREGTLIFEGADLTPTHAWALRRATKAIMFTVANSNAMIPRLQYAAGAAPSPFRTGIEYSMDASGVSGNYDFGEFEVTYSADERLPEGLEIDPETGLITGIIAASGASQSYTFTVTGSVPAGTALTDAVSREFTINQASITEIPALANGRVGVPYFSDAIQISLNLEIDPSEITYQLDPGLRQGWTWIRRGSAALPQGLVINNDGTITGTPTQAITRTVTFLVSAPGFVDTLITRTITILPAIPVITFGDAILPAGEVGSQYEAQLVASGAEGITFASENLPAGLTLAANGLISGTPTVVGTYLFEVTASAEGATSTVASIALNVAEEAEIILPAIVFNDRKLDAGKVGVAYSATLTASGADGITFASENLPAGLTLAANGSISGTPTEAGTYLFKVIASAEGATSTVASIVLSVAEEDEVILPVIVFSDRKLDSGKVGVAYSATLTASGATGITFASENLPAGLTLAANGKLSGTPTQAGTYLITVTASATGAQSATASIVLSVAEEDEVILPIIVFSDRKLDAGKVGVAYSATLTASGATGITFASENLPAGLTLAANGKLSGTPTQAGIYLITVTASATGAQSTTASIVLSVAEEDEVILPVIVFNDRKLDAGKVGVAYNATLTASGATGITFASENLPAGLTLAANGKLSGTPTQAGTYLITVTASATGAQSTTASIVLSVSPAAATEAPAISFNSALLASGTVGTAYSATLTASGAEGITFASSDLPAGLTLNEDGSISGTPTQAGTYLFTVTASATGAQSATASIAIHIASVAAPITGCASALTVSTIIMTLLTSMVAGVFIFIRKRQ